jgi:D-glycero-alpha-D-manno-heptose-7-phosphate kinase
LIVSKTPLRISFAGGGTDLPDFYRSETGAVTGATIDKYVYVGVNRRRDRWVLFRYARTELVADAAQLRHPIAREALRLLDVRHGVEIVSVADVPAGTGLGSSSSFTVGLLAALHAFVDRPASPWQLAEEACHIELERLGEPLGKQDQYLAALGGVLHLQFHPDGGVTGEEVACPPGWLPRLQEGLLLLDTGVTRRASAVLARQAEATRSGRNLSALRRLRELAVAFRDVARRGGSLAECGAVLHEAWQLKRGLADSVSTPEIDARYDRALAAGAWGGKLLGAGGGGFLLVCCPPERRAAVREATGLSELPFRLDPAGTRLHRLT